jgi:hypothetical protein
MTRSEFIFISILRDFDLDFANEPYDVQFDLGPKFYKKFLKSEFNDPTKSEDENIEKYLTLEYIDEDIDVIDED